MDYGHEGCKDWLEPRYEGVHYLMVRLLNGRCTCQAPTARVHELYAVTGVTRSYERESA